MVGTFGGEATTSTRGFESRAALLIPASAAKPVAMIDLFPGMNFNLRGFGAALRCGHAAGAGQGR